MTEDMMANGVTATFAYAHLMGVERKGTSVRITLAKDGVLRTPVFIFDDEDLAVERHKEICEKWNKYLADEDYDNTQGGEE